MNCQGISNSTQIYVGTSTRKKFDISTVAGVVIGTAAYDSASASVKSLAHIFFGKIIAKAWLKIYCIADV